MSKYNYSQKRISNTLCFFLLWNSTFGFALSSLIQITFINLIVVSEAYFNILFEGAVYPLDFDLHFLDEVDTCNKLQLTHHHHHQSLNHVGQWGTTDDFATNFLHVSLFSTAL